MDEAVIQPGKGFASPTTGALDAKSVFIGSGFADGIGDPERCV